MKILGVENRDGKEPLNGSLVDPGCLNRTIVPDVLVDFDKLNHADMDDCSGSVTTLPLAVPTPSRRYNLDVHTLPQALVCLPLPCPIRTVLSIPLV